MKTLSLKELESKLQGFYEVDEEEKQRILQSILEAANAEPERFKERVHKQVFDEFNHLPIIYEVLSKDLENWSDFFVDESKRLLEIAKQSKTPQKVLNHLKEFGFIDTEKFKDRKRMVEIMKAELDNPHPTFRFYAIDLLTEFMEADDYHTIERLRRRLKDPDWKIRYWAYQALNDMGRVDRLDKLSWQDKLRARFLDSLDFK